MATNSILNMVRLMAAALGLIGCWLIVAGVTQIANGNAAMQSARIRANAMIEAARGKDEIRLAKKERLDQQRCIVQFSEYQCAAFLFQHRGY